jgi:hypothetical protein
MRRDVIAAYVEKLLATLTDGVPVTADDDGDYPIRYRSALYYVRLVGDERPDVQVFAIAVAGVAASAELLADVNDINTRARFARVFHVRDQVLVETDLVGDAVEPNSFYNACRTVARITDDIGPELVAKHGGRTAFDDAKDADYAAPDLSEPSVGQYL